MSLVPVTGVAFEPENFFALRPATLKDGLVPIATKYCTVEDLNSADYQTALVYHRNKVGKLFRREEVVNTKTVQRYHQDLTLELRGKGSLITIGLPLFAVVKLAVYVVRAATLVISSLYRGIAEFYKVDFVPAMKNLGNTLFYEIPASLLTSIVSIVKTPFCYLAMTFCALFTIISPLHGRVALGDVEKFWTGIDRVGDVLRTKGKPDERIVDFFTNRNSQYGFFMAYCFQSWGSLDDPNISGYVLLAPNS